MKTRGYLGTWGLYSLKLKAVPHPKLLKQLPLNALLPDVLRILSLGRYEPKRWVSLKEDMNNVLFLTPVDHSFPLSAEMSLGLLKTPNPASRFPRVRGDEPLTGRQKVWAMVR